MVDQDAPRPEPEPEAIPRPDEAQGGGFLGWLARHWASLLLGLLAGAGGMFFWVQRDIDTRAANAQAALVQARQTLEADLQAQLARAESLQGELLIEQGTRQGLEAALKTAQAELGQAREKVAFFDQLLPAGPGGAVSVRGLDITQRDAILFYRVLLTRQAPANGAPFEGRLVFEAKGRQDGKEAKLPLEFLADADAKDGESEKPVSFEWFLRQEGYLKMPKGFVPSGLELRVYEGKTLKQSHAVDLPAAP